jgi:DNA-binding response OmpR family regulator
VPSTLLAVDDSVTMRKVLEITFAGSDVQVVTANSYDAALQKLSSDRPQIVVADVTLDPSGYDLCKAVKTASPGTPVLILSSKQNPYDAAKGSAAHADDHIDKPFDTQQMIDKVRKLLAGGATAQPAVAPAAAAPPPMRQPTPGPLPAVPAAAAAAPVQRAKTLIYNPPVGTPSGPSAPPNQPVAVSRHTAPTTREPAVQFAPTPVTGVPLQSTGAPPPVPAHAAPAHAAPAHAAPAAHGAAMHVNGQMAGKLEGLGLTPAQVDAVMALSREVVERVVWEVVPVLAETLIKEELARLTK